jgi:hypothetical protein
MAIEDHPLMTKLGAMSPQELELRRREIASKAQGDYENISIEHLEELAFITSTLRKRSAGPPKAPKPTKGPKTLDDLANM